MLFAVIKLIHEFPMNEGHVIRKISTHFYNCEYNFLASEDLEFDQ